jgi:hypothetical protein
MSRFFGVAALSICLLSPGAVVNGQDHDRDHHATHQWNDNENQSWHQYLKEKRKKDHDWEKASKREQKNYWKWRDAHPDTH